MIDLSSLEPIVFGFYVKSDNFKPSNSTVLGFISYYLKDGFVLLNNSSFV